MPSRPSSLRRSILLAAAVPLVVSITVLGALGFWRKIQTFQPLGFDGRQVAGGWQVTQAPPDSGLLAGDRLLLVDGVDPGDGLALRARLHESSVSRLLVERADQLVEVAVARPALDPDLPYLFLALSAVVYFCLGLYTLARQQRPETAIFFLWCIASGVLGLYTPTLGERADILGRTIYFVEQAARIVLPALTLHLFLIFPSSRAATSAPTATRKAWLPFLYLPAAALFVLHSDLVLSGGAWLFGPATASSLALLDRLDLFHLVAFAAASVVALLFRRRRQEWEERRQLLWVASGLALGYGPFVALYVLPRAVGAQGPEWLSAIAVLPLAAVPLAFAYAILRYRLWDVGVILRDAAAWTLTLLVGAVGFSLAQLAIRRGVPGDLAEARSVLTFLSGIGIAATLVPARRTIGTSFERLHYRGAFGKRRSLGDLGQELLHERDLDALCAKLLTRLGEALEIDRFNLFLAQDGALVPARPEPGIPAQMPLEALGERVWGTSFTPLRSVALPTLHPGPVERLFASGYRYAFPLMVRDTRVGIALSSYRQEGQPLSTEDLELVRSLLTQAALAIENAQLVDQLHRQLDETIRLRLYNEGVIESSPAGIAVIDPAGSIESANLAFAALIGIERRLILGRPLVDLLPIAPLPEPGAGMREVSFCDLTGRERFLQVGAALLPGQNARPGTTTAGRVLIVQDVSDQVAMENALKEKDRLAALGLLAAGVAHEVNTPITGISSYAQMLLADTAESDPRYELLKKVERQTFRASRIVNSLLDFARNPSAETHPVDLSAVLRETVEMLRERLAERRIAVDLADETVGARVLGNDGELQQVFTNLLNNAIDAMTPGGGALRLRMVDEANGRVSVTVEDEGPGIPDGLVDRVFQPFFTTKLGQGGTGLGLAISYQIVRRHGGILRAENLPQRGCRFTVDLPRLPLAGADT